MVLHLWKLFMPLSTFRETLHIAHWCLFKNFPISRFHSDVYVYIFKVWNKDPFTFQKQAVPGNGILL